MKTKYKKWNLLAFLIFAAGLIQTGLNQSEAAPSMVQTWNDEQLRSDFAQPPSSTRVACYWYWISDHISVEGVVNDLYAMKEAGITRAYIGNIGLDGLSGDVKFDTEKWWEALHAAMKTATELDIEIGLFNSPGWSQSGGPWVKPEQAMRYLLATSAEVAGGQRVNIELKPPAADFQDVRVIAFPAIYPEKEVQIKSIQTSPSLEDASNLIDGNRTSGTHLGRAEDGCQYIDLTLAEEGIVRSLKIFVHEYGVNTTAHLQVKKGEEFVTLADFKIDRYNRALNVGFQPLAPVVVALPEVSGTEFRLIVDNSSNGLGLAEIELSSMPYIERYPEKTLGKMFQEPLPYWHEYQWKTAPEVSDANCVIDRTRVLDISKSLSGNTLDWEAPEGKWVVMRIGAVPTGVKNSPASKEATGLEVDKMSQEHIASHFDAFMGMVMRRIPEKDRKCWKVVVMDSYEMGGQNYTDTLWEDFQKRYGYDPIPFLPVIEGFIVESREISDRFLWDLRRLIADKVAYDYIGGLRKISNRNGLTTWLENYGHWGFPGEFLQYGGQSDEIGGEFWAVGSLGDIENRAASSCGHIYGKRKIYAESFTSGNYSYSDYPAIFKERGDRFFTEGINSTLLHLYIHQPYEDRQPGVNAWFGSDFNRFNIWFPQMDLFTDYLKRVNYMLQQGLNVADVAYFIGEDTPKMTGITHPALPKGYQFDYINAEVLERDLSVKDGYLVLPHGTRYRLLVLPPQETMRPELLKKIQKLIEQGAVVMGPAPKRSPSLENYPQADVEVRKIAEELWSGDETYKKIGRGMLIKGEDIQAALDKINCPPDFRCAVEQPLLYSHRTLKGGEIYFISNQSKQTIKAFPEFRVQGLRPEWWDATTGKTRPLASYKETSTGIIVPISLAANESTFIVFREKISSFNLPVLVDFNCPSPKVVQSLNGPWKVELLNPFRQMKKEIDLPKLINLTQSEDPEVKYFSGTASYHSQFTLEQMPDSEKEVFFLDLGKVNVMAKVKINGKYVGGIWTSPYRVDVTEALIQGINQVEIEVVNTWCNRMIGDMNLPKEERRFWVINNAWKADSPLQPSGLEGPVTLQSVDIYLELPSEVIGKKEKENLEIKNSSQ